jgi:hypothetical protein
MDLSHDWNVSFAGGEEKAMATLTSWEKDASTHYYSGQATYRKTIDVEEADVKKGRTITLDFGEGRVVEKPEPLPRFNMRAYLDSPVREAAQVFVNDELAGYVWHPPFRVDISRWVKPGKNQLRIVVSNTAINALAGTSLPSYRLLYDHYGMEFQPQDMHDLEPLPSGILGSVTLIKESAQ